MPRGRFNRIDRSKLLVGEGRDEVEFFTSLLSHLGISGVQVTDYGGKPKLREFLATLRRIPGFADLRTLAVTCDADDDPAAGKQSIESALESANLPPELTVRTLVLPSDETRGALETLCVEAFANKPIGECVERFISCAAEAGYEPKWSVGGAAKARAQMWLAFHARPALRLGEAAQAGCIDWDEATYVGLKAFLGSL